MERIVLTADAHGSDGIGVAREWAQREGADRLFILGDVWDIQLPSPDVPTHYIRGNHEQRKYDERWGDPTIDIPGVTLHDDYTTFEVEGVTFGVLGRMDGLAVKGINPAYLGHPKNREFVRKEMGLAVEDLGDADILLYHDAPAPHDYGHGGPPGGSPYLADLAREVGADMVFHGHTHTRKTKILPDSNIEVRNLPPCDPLYTQEQYQKPECWDYDVMTIEDGEWTVEHKVEYR